MEATERRAGGRAAAVLFTGAGALTILNLAMPQRPGSDATVILALGLASLAVGAVAAVLPWERWPDRALLALVPLAMALIGVGHEFGGKEPYTYAVYYVVMFAWLGMAQPRGTSLALGPLAVAAYAVPFVTGSDALGVRSVSVAIPVCVLVGELVAKALDEVRRARALDTRRAAGLEALVAAGTALHGEADRHRIGDLAAALATGIVHADGAAVVLTGGTGFVTAGAHRLAPAGADAVVAGSAVAQRLAGDPAMLLPAEPEPTGERDLVVPLQGAVRTIGLLVVRFPGSGERDAFARHATQLFAAQAALAIEQLDVIEALTDAAVRDGLTGVGNRRHADALVAGLEAGDAVVIVDLDHFKRVNDTRGHAAGDAVLVELGRFLRQSVRDADDVARLGGEEFVVVLRGAAHRAADTASRLVDGWRAMLPATTMSAGVAVHEPGASPVDTLARADSALYDAKRGGRDRAVACA